MNIINVSGVNAYRAAAKPPTIARNAASRRSAAPDRSRDWVELQFSDVLTAEKEGYIEVGGKRFAVTEDMASQMRRAYEQMQARNEARAARKAAEENARAARQQTEALEKEGKSMRQAMEIARRIAKGGHVPPQDEKFLMEYSQEMYMAAKMQGMLAEEHKKEDSVLDEEDEETGGTEEIGEDGGDTRATVEATVADGAVASVGVGEAPASADG